MLSKQSVPRDPTVEEWLKEFLKDSTKSSYRSALNRYKNLLEISDFETYLQSNPDIVSDMRKFLSLLNGKPPKTLKTYSGAVNVFLSDNGYKISDDDWKKLTRRGYMPKRVMARTQDKKPTKEMLKQILDHANIKGRALVLFLVSSGARIGETLQLKKQDLELEANPPKAYIRAEYTKGGVGARTVYFSDEARGAIKEWLKVKDTMKKTTGESFSGDKVFPWNSHTARFMFYLACDKAGIDGRDVRTNRRLVHLHSLRKFFRSNSGLGADIVHALMGHSEYLDDAYLRLDEEGEIAEAYLKAMPNLSVFTIEDKTLQKKTDKLEEENTELKKRVKQLESKESELDNMKDKFSKVERENAETKEEMKQLSLKFNSIVEKLEKLLEG